MSLNRLPDRADRLREVLDRMVRRHIAGLEMDLGGAQIIARDEAVQDLGQEATLFRAQPAHDAEIDRDEPAVMVDEQVSGMHVGVEEAVAHGVAQEGLDDVAAELRQVESPGAQRRLIVERRAVDPFEREHVARGAVPVDRGHAEARIVLGVLGHLRQRGRLEPQVHLDRDRARQRLHHLDEAQPPRLGRPFFGGAGRPEEGGQIGLEALLDARTEHLHGDHAAARQFRPMHLRDRRRRDRRAEGGEDVRNPAAERRRDRGLGLLLRKRRHAVLQALEIARERDADHVAPGRQELPELDVSRPERGQRDGQAVGLVAARRPLDQPRAGKRRARRQRERRRIDEAEHAFAREHEAGAGQPDEMDECRDHKRQPECSATTPPVSGRALTRRKPAAEIIAAKACGLGKRRIDSTR